MSGVIKGLFLGILLTLLTLLAGAAVWLTVAYTGRYNVAASDRHRDAVRWTLDSTMHRSVSRRAGSVRMPVSVPEGMQEAGARHYAESCAHCHGAPGRGPAGWSRGMRPEPPHLTEAAAEWSPEELLWIIENGIKMSGMPAFGTHLGPEDTVAIAAFVRGLPDLTAEDYAAMTGAGD